MEERYRQKVVLVPLEYLVALIAFYLQLSISFLLVYHVALPPPQKMLRTCGAVVWGDFIGLLVEVPQFEVRLCHGAGRNEPVVPSAVVRLGRLGSGGSARQRCRPAESKLCHGLKGYTGVSGRNGVVGFDGSPSDEWGWMESVAVMIPWKVVGKTCKLGTCKAPKGTPTSIVRG